MSENETHPPEATVKNGEDKASPLQAEHLQFPEDKIQGQGFSQYNPKTGWLWVGIHLPSFLRHTAWAFVTSQRFLFEQAFDNIEQERMRRMQLTAGGKGNGRHGFIPNLIGKFRGH